MPSRFWTWTAAGTSARGCTSPAPMTNSAMSADGHNTASASMATYPPTSPSGKPSGPGSGPSRWFDAAWLRGAIAYLDWILGDTLVTPVTRQPKRISPVRTSIRVVIAGQRRMYGVGAGRYDIEEEVSRLRTDSGPCKGARARNPSEPDMIPAAAMVRGSRCRPMTGQPARTASHPLTVTAAERLLRLPRRLRCCYEAAGYCLRGQCPACTGRICDAGWAAIAQSYDQPYPAEQSREQPAHPDERGDQVSLLDELRDMGWFSGS